MHDNRVVVDARTHERRNLLAAQDLLEHRAVRRCQHETVSRVLGDGEPAVAVHGLGDIDEEGMRDGIAGVGEEDVDDLLGIVAGRARIPQCEGCDAVRVDVLRGPLELGEWRNRAPGLVGRGMADLEQEGLVALDDEGPIAHADSPARMADTSAATRAVRCGIAVALAHSWSA